MEQLMYGSIQLTPARTAAAVCALAASVSLPVLADDALVNMSQDPAQWVMPGGDYGVNRFSKLDQINTANVQDMRVAWTMSTGTLRGQEGQPLVVGDMMYFESSYPNYIYAVNLDNIGQMAWKYTPKQDSFAPSIACCDLVNRGLAYADGKVIADTLDGQVLALDAKTGALQWKAKNVDPELGKSMTSAPLVVHGHVIVGVSGGEYGVRGYLTAYDLRTGQRQWRAYSTGPDDSMLIDPDKTIDGGDPATCGDGL